MPLFLASLAVFLVLGLAALVSGGGRWADRWGAAGAVLGGALGLIPALRAFLGGPPETLSLPWGVPYGSFTLEIDALSGFFLMPIFGLCALAAPYGASYLAGRPGRSRAGAWFFYNLLAAAMAVVVAAGNGVLFLAAWEVMSLASFFLVTLDHHLPDVRKAGWTYLVAAHLGTAFLLVMFILLGRNGGSLDFDSLSPGSVAPGLLFLLGLVGFGTKAGFVPFHVWLPEAHPVAPSHVSAVMSGAMIKTGIYGLLRLLVILGHPPPWWGWLLVGVGLVSAMSGILFALAQDRIKRLLAFSSVENVGIAALGLGLGLLGISAGRPALAVLGFAGGLFHVVNHAFFKGLLFLGAGAVVHETGTGDMDRLGGLLRRMPWTGAAFFTGVAAMAALPPLNGFAGELLIFLGALHGQTFLPLAYAVPLLASVIGLALVGGLAFAAVTKMFGSVFLGEPRSEAATRANDPGPAMRLPMAVLAAGCLLLGIAAPSLVGTLEPLVIQVTGLPIRVVGDYLLFASGPLTIVSAVGTLAFALTAALGFARLRLLSGRQVDAGPTWDCGYARPEPRMEYTASSFSQPLTELFTPLLRPRIRLRPPEGLFPREAGFSVEVADPGREKLYRPFFSLVGQGLAKIRWLQHGYLHLYILYIAVTLLALMIWQLGSPG